MLRFSTSTAFALFPEHYSFDLVSEIFASSNCSINLRFVAQYFIPLLTYVEKGLASAIVDPLTIAAYRRFRGDPGNIVFRPLKPAVEFGVAMLTPAYRPASLLAKAFSECLTVEFLKIGAKSSSRLATMKPSASKAT